MGGCPRGQSARFGIISLFRRTRPGGFGKHEKGRGDRMIEALSAKALPMTGDSPVVLMVSGGSDSTALLVRAARGEVDLGEGPGGVRPDRLCALHVNHCLRGEASDGDERFVVDLCARLGVACEVRRVEIPRLLGEMGGGNMEEVAREERYAAAWELACRLAARAGVEPGSARIAVAHTADDRVETFLMRAVTGAGMAGMSGMRASRGVVVRPLLGETRVELREYLTSLGIGWREDATNAEDGALRSYMRNRVVPALAARNPSLHRTIGRELDVMAEEDELLDRLAAREAARLAVPARPGVLAFDAAGLAACEPALARRALRHALAEALGPSRFRDMRLEARHVESVLALAAAGSGSRPLPLGAEARVCRGVLAIRLPEDRPGEVAGAPAGPAAATAAPGDVELRVPSEVTWGGSRVAARLVEVPAGEDARAWARAYAREVERERGAVEGRDFVLVDAAAVGLAGGSSDAADPDVALTVGAPREGERLRPFGLSGSKLVSDLLNEAGVPLCDRALVPVVRARYRDGSLAGDRGCVWVGGIRLDARAAYGPQTRVLVELSVICGFTRANGRRR